MTARPDSTTPLAQAGIAGLGAARRRRLADAGVHTLGQLAALQEAELVTLAAVGRTQATAILRAARRLAGNGRGAPRADPAGRRHLVRLTLHTTAEGDAVRETEAEVRSPTGGTRRWPGWDTAELEGFLLGHGVPIGAAGVSLDQPAEPAGPVGRWRVVDPSEGIRLRAGAADALEVTVVDDDGCADETWISAFAVTAGGAPGDLVRLGTTRAPFDDGLARWTLPCRDASLDGDGELLVFVRVHEPDRPSGSVRVDASLVPGGTAGVDDADRSAQ